MNVRNLLVLMIAVAAMVYAFFSGGYPVLRPFIFIAGLGVAVAVSAYAVLKMETLPLVVFLAAATLVAAVDEYAHTAAGTLAYFDHGVPSLLTVFGWGIFMLVMLVAARLLVKNVSRAAGRDIPDGGRTLRLLPVLVPCVLIAVSVTMTGYLPVFTPLLAVLFILLAVSSLYYAARQPVAWNISVLIVSIITGGVMEYLGALEGLWTFHYGEPISLFILFSWPLRVSTVLCICLIAGYDVCGNRRVPSREP